MPEHPTIAAGSGGGGARNLEIGTLRVGARLPEAIGALKRAADRGCRSGVGGRRLRGSPLYPESVRRRRRDRDRGQLGAWRVDRGGTGYAGSLPSEPRGTVLERTPGTKDLAVRV